MDYNRTDRFGSTLRKNLADIFLFEINNPKLKGTSIIDVVISDDLKSAQVIFSNPQIKDELEVYKELIRAKGFIRKLLSQKMYLKYVPELKFLFGDKQNKKSERTIK